jgi:hypothetical protein
MSEHQREVNRINGSKGGPSTPEGKAICAQNSRRHGLTAKKLVLNSEEEAIFTEMLEEYMALFNPANVEETDLIREIVSGRWRQERWWDIESAMLDLSAQEAQPAIDEVFSAIGPEARIAFMLMKDHGLLKGLGLVSLYESRMRRLHERARRDLERVQAARTPKQPQPAKLTKLAPVPDVDPPEPISFRSFISKEELARLDEGKSRPTIALDLPETFPEDIT